MMFTLVIIFAILAIAFACVLSCDPKSNNQPECSSKNLNVAIRDFWDPNRYWLCTYVSDVASHIFCPENQYFDPAKGTCILVDFWKWIDLCISI